MIKTAVKILYRAFAVTMLVCVPLITAQASFKKPAGCSEMVDLSRQDRLQRADIAFQGRMLHRDCECRQNGTAHCTTKLQAIKSYKGADPQKTYRFESHYKLDFGCSSDYITSLEKAEPRTTDYFLKRTNTTLSRVPSAVCANSMKQKN
jgi:hypothetical protein